MILTKIWLKQQSLLHEIMLNLRLQQVMITMAVTTSSLMSIMADITLTKSIISLTHKASHILTVTSTHQVKIMTITGMGIIICKGEG